MLKALELVGFKSFADRTRFEFAAGITCVVGPNGSGKSNVVDAMKWVLGEQSVKSLRGKEMADVIFNGSSSRPPLNSAETTLIFDNSRRLLSVDSDEVYITRRVYRSGEGEYLINRQPSRLRDIRELFSGTGVATEAYSVIEQGKVDVLLQSSPRDRRAIFEEAAGISRFKAKKVESLRRLERVDQNLLRLSDIVEEVENRLRGVRQQAAKARRYQEHAGRLQELRTQVASADWRKLSTELESTRARLDRLAAEAQQAAASADALEADSVRLEDALGRSAEELRASEGQAAQLRERMSALDAAMEHERARGRELEDEMARHRRQVSAMTLRAGDLRQQLAETRDAVGVAQRRHREIQEQLRTEQEALSTVTAELADARAKHEACRAKYVDQMRDVAAVQSELGALEFQVQAARANEERARQQLALLDEQRMELDRELDGLQRQRELLSAEADHSASSAAESQDRLSSLRKQHLAQQGTFNDLRQRRAVAAERATLLEQLDRRQEGLTTGVKEVLGRARDKSQAAFSAVRGLVADLIQVSVEFAPLVDVALGDRAQQIVLNDKDQELIEFLQANPYHFQARVGFLRSVSPSLSPTLPIVDLAGRPGVVARADRCVESEPSLRPLVERLLGTTWFVEKLTDALALSREHGQLSLVTLAGELVTADGALAVGPRQTLVGLVSRRSEWRVLKRQLLELDGQIATASDQVRRLETQIAQCDEQVRNLLVAQHRAAEALSEQRARLRAAEDRAARLDEQRAALAAEQAEQRGQMTTSSAQLEALQRQLRERESHLAAQEREVTRYSQSLAGSDDRRRGREQEVTAAQVQLAASDERLASLRLRLGQFEQDQQERGRSIADAQTQLASCQQREERSRLAILENESRLAELYLEKDVLAQQLTGLASSAETRRAEREHFLAQAKRFRQTWRKIEEDLHRTELAATGLEHERSALAGRLREDYGIELAELEHQIEEEQHAHRDEIDREIGELRRKLANLGNVNLDALAELDELEQRFTTLKSQFDDLTEAKKALEQIIHKINADSRRLFAATLDTVRGHFQALFRKLFGGGQANIVLEENVDILDAGIEIIARPPGKEPRNISLLSGGEKTLTCVALLLAIFQYRPSPFCVLDEVDAALDEANIERFVAVLQEFLAWTQFIVVTHSKKTMTCAHTLYGVTMQESGISKRVSVRFEDVSENGQFELATASPGKETGDDTQAA